MEETKAQRGWNLPTVTELSERRGWDLEAAHETAHTGLGCYSGVLEEVGGTPLAIPPFNTGHIPAGLPALTATLGRGAVNLRSLQVLDTGLEGSSLPQGSQC